MLNVNWDAYSTYLDNPVDNVLFFDFSGNALYAWMENGTSNLATNSIAWVKLNSTGIPASSSRTIYLGFYSTGSNQLSASGPFGEAPQLSATYAQYDNGANVFLAYFNGNTPTSNFNLGTGITLTQLTGVSYGSNTINVLHLTGTGNDIVMVYKAVSLSNSPIIAESNFESQALPTSQGAVSLDDNILPASSRNAIGADIGYGRSYFSQAYQTGGTYTFDQNQQGTANSNWNYASLTYLGSGAASWNAYIAPQLYSTNGGYSGTTNNNPLSASSQIYLSVLSSASASYPDNMYYNWMRAQAYPPNGVMPSATFGSVTPSGNIQMQPSIATLGTSSVNSATTYSFERKTIYSQGLWWAFYSDGTNIIYKTSPDGSSWSAPVIVTSSTDSTNGYNFNIWQSGSTIYYVLTAYGSGASFLWRYGTLQSNGGINWAISETSVGTTNTVHSYTSIVADNSGNVWVALNTNDGTNTHVEVWKYSTGTWSNVNDVSPLPSDTAPILVPLAQGVALIYGEGSLTSQIKITTTLTGTVWSPSVSPRSDYALFDSSATAIGNTIYFAGLASSSTGATTGKVDTWSFASGGSTTSPETTLQSSAANWVASVSQSSNSLLVFYASGANVYGVYSTNLGISWSSTQTISNSETAATGLTSTYAGGGVIWTSGGSNPFNVRFASVSILSVTNNSPFAVHLVSLYIFGSNTETLVHFDVNSSAIGVSGLFDYWLGAGETLSVPLSFIWVTNQNYLLTVTTDQGVILSSTFEAPQ